MFINTSVVNGLSVRGKELEPFRQWCRSPDLVSPRPGHTALKPLAGLCYQPMPACSGSVVVFDVASPAQLKPVLQLPGQGLLYPSDSLARLARALHCLDQQQTLACSSTPQWRGSASPVCLVSSSVADQWYTSLHTRTDPIFAWHVAVWWERAHQPPAPYSRSPSGRGRGLHQFTRTPPCVPVGGVTLYSREKHSPRAEQAAVQWLSFPESMITFSACDFRAMSRSSTRQTGDRETGFCPVSLLTKNKGRSRTFVAYSVNVREPDIMFFNRCGSS